MNVETVATICHNANRDLCIAQGDYSQKTWEEAEQWQRDSAIKGVEYKLANMDATPEDQHKAWCDDKYANGWSYGPIKNPEIKEHHCLVPYNELPKEQQAKDHLFANIVSVLAPFIEN